MKLKHIYLITFCIFVFSKVNSDEVYNLGKEVFLNNGNCASCHTLKDANSMANVVMPSMLGILSNDEIKAVAYYVSEASMK